MAKPRRTGFLDESYDYQGAQLVYVLGLLLIDDAAVDGVRQELRNLPRTSTGLLHFAKEKPARRRIVSAEIAALDLTLRAVVGRGNHRNSRARAVALRALAGAWHGDLDLLVIESRGGAPDRDDRDLLSALHPPAHRIDTEFRTKKQEPVLWIPDFVAGAVFQALVRNDPEPLKALGDVDQLEC